VAILLLSKYQIESKPFKLSEDHHATVGLAMGNIKASSSKEAPGESPEVKLASSLLHQALIHG